VKQGISVTYTWHIQRDNHPSTGRTHGFDLPVPATTAASDRNPDKAKLKEIILALRAQGWSYRQIAAEVGLHWTRVGQILWQADKK